MLLETELWKDDESLSTLYTPMGQIKLSSDGHDVAKLIEICRSARAGTEWDLKEVTHKTDVLSGEYRWPFTETTQKQRLYLVSRVGNTNFQVNDNDLCYLRMNLDHRTRADGFLDYVKRGGSDHSC